MVQSTGTAKKKKVSTISYEQFVKMHKSQLTLIPKLYWRSLYEKITFSIFDINKNIKVETKQITYANEVKKQMTARVCNKNGIRQDDPQSIFLIQHLIHYYAVEGRELLKELIVNRDPLLTYLKKLMNVNDTDACTFIDNILSESWKYAISFQIKSKGNKKSLPIWSITQQVGMVIKHSFDPNFQMITFRYLNSKRIYSIIFPIKSIVNYGDEVTRDYSYFEKLNYDQLEFNAQMQQKHIDQDNESSKLTNSFSSLNYSSSEKQPKKVDCSR